MVKHHQLSLEQTTWNLIEHRPVVSNTCRRVELQLRQPPPDKDHIPSQDDYRHGIHATVSVVARRITFTQSLPSYNVRY